MKSLNKNKKHIKPISHRADSQKQQHNANDDFPGTFLHFSAMGFLLLWNQKIPVCFSLISYEDYPPFPELVEVRAWDEFPAGLTFPERVQIELHDLGFHCQLAFLAGHVVKGAALMLSAKAFFAGIHRALEAKSRRESRARHIPI